MRPPRKSSPIVQFLVCLFAVAVGLDSTTLWAQRNLKDIPDPDPELERKSFQIADGFEVNLYAADPLFAKPIQMNFDPQGRLWIASSEIYPHIAPGQPATDKILVIEDTDHDGVADQTRVFADGLLIPTGVEPGDGGVYVANSTELIHLSDSNGDGKADSKRVVLSGFGTEDTHHIIHTFRWGMDGALYFNQSIYIHSHVETPWGVRRLGGGGIWQFRPDSLRLEVFARGLVNTWGHHQDDWGQSFATDGAGGEGINFMFPGSVYLTAPGATRIMKGLNPGSPKFCGLEIVSGTHFPESWRGNLITNDFRGHRVCRFVLSEDGSGYAAREQAEVIKTDHDAFRPIDVKMGPDGALYIADWYNPIIQHGEVDFRDSRRDHTHGRIWRVTAKGRHLAPYRNLTNASNAELLAVLKTAEAAQRQHAKRVLQERGADKVLPDLTSWTLALDAVSPGFEHERLEALWVYQSLNSPRLDLLDQVLKSPEPKARAAAIRVLAAWKSEVERPLDRLATGIADDHPRVRLEAVRALSEFPSIASAELALLALDRPLDANLDFALWQTLRDLQASWLPAVKKGEIVFGGEVRKLTFALNAVGAPGVVAPLVELLKSGKVSPTEQEQVLSLIAALGGPDELGLVVTTILALPVSPEKTTLCTRVFNTLAEASTRRKIIPSGDLGGIVSLLGGTNELDMAICRAAGAWNVRSTEPIIRTIAFSNSSAAGAAIQAMTAFGGAENTAELKKLGQSAGSIATRMLAIQGLLALAPDLGAELAVDLLANLKPQEDPTPLFASLWQTKSGPDKLLLSLRDRKIPADVAKIGVRTARIAGRDLGQVVVALTTSGGLNAPLTEIPSDQLLAMVNQVREQGNPMRGEAIFRRQETLCLRCHAISGAGGQVGPDLTSIGASAQVDYLIESLLLPNKAVKENYHSLVVETQAGKILNGVKIRENANELVLRNAEDVEVSIPISEIAERMNGGSIMPAGLTDTLTQTEIIDLVRFLSELGKLGPYAPSPIRVARRWQALDPNTPGLAEILISAPAGIVNRRDLVWSPFYSSVSGDLPLADPPVVTYPIGGVKAVIVRAQLEVTSAGQVGFAVPAIDGLSMWVDESPVPVNQHVSIDLKPGIHTVTLRAELATRKSALRIELEDVAGSPAQVRWVSGK